MARIESRPSRLPSVSACGGSKRRSPRERCASSDATYGGLATTISKRRPARGWDHRGWPSARCATSMSTLASWVSVRTRIGLAASQARFTPRTCAISTWASTRSMVAVASSSAAFTVCIGSSARLCEAGELLGLVLGGERAGQVGKVAVHDRVDLVQREVDAVVGHASLREVVGADAVGAIAAADEALPLGRFLRGSLARLLVLDARGEDAPRLLLVLVLAAP